MYLRTTAARLAAIVATQVVNVFLCRDARASASSRGLARSRMILWGVGVRLILPLEALRKRMRRR